MCWKSFVLWTRHFRCVKIWCRNSKRSINNFQVTCSPNKYNGQFRTPIQFHFMIIYTKYFFNLLNKFFKMAQIVSFFDYFMLRNNLTNIPTRKFFNNVFNLTNFRFIILLIFRLIHDMYPCVKFYSSLILFTIFQIHNNLLYLTLQTNCWQFQN